MYQLKQACASPDSGLAQKITIRTPYVRENTYLHNYGGPEVRKSGFFSRLRTMPYSPSTFYEDFLHFATHSVDFVRGEQSMYLYLLSFTLLSFCLIT